MEAPENINRWNFDADDEGLLLCKGDHDKSDHCEEHQERLSPHEALKIINALRTDALKTEQIQKENAALKAKLRVPEITPEMIDAGAQRLVNWGEEDCVWPNSFDALCVAAARNAATAAEAHGKQPQPTNTINQSSLTQEESKALDKALLSSSKEIDNTNAIKAAAAFLLERLECFESELDDKAYREWNGHIVPPMARLKYSLQPPQDQREGES